MRIAGSILLVLWYASGAPAWSAEILIVPGTLRSGKAYVSCYFDGVKERCFLDTGSAMTLLDNSKHFTQHPNPGTIHYQGASAILEAVDTIEIARAQIDRTSFHSVRVGRIRPEQSGESTLGIDLIARQPFSMHFRQTPSLNLHARTPPRVCHDLHVKHGLLGIPVSIRGQTVRALWDTGATLTAVDQSYIQSYPENFKGTRQSAEGKDAGGRPLLGRLYRARSLQIGSRTFRNVPVIALDLSLLREHLAPDVQAVVGFNLIRKCDWFFDRERKEWSVQ